MKKELELMTGRVSTLSKKCEQSKAELKDKKNAKDDKVTNSAMILNMKSIHENLQQKKEYQHKTVLVDLHLKFKEMEIMLASKEDKITALTEETKYLKKNSSSVNELKVASLRSEIQIRSMQDKNTIR